MADDPAHGVVDRDCRVHGLENLYVAGSSVFPTSGTAGPTLTIVALAVRLADHLRDRTSASSPAEGVDIRSTS
jgi:choline dehydrogenase-like flavoprotein